MRNPVALLAALALVSCAHDAPLASEPVDWGAVDERWSVHLVTLDPDGDTRVTRVWLAVVDGAGTVRTNHSRWARNLQRDPSLRLRVLGIDYPLRVEFVDDTDATAAIDAAFREKYGWQDGPIGEHAFFMRLVPRAR